MISATANSIDEVLPFPLEKAKTSKLITPETKVMLNWDQDQALIDSLQSQLELIEDGEVATTVFVSHLLTAMGLHRHKSTTLYYINQSPLLLHFGEYKSSALIDFEVFRRMPRGTRRLPLAFGFEHKKKKQLGLADISIDAQIGSELLALAQQEYSEFGWKKKQKEKIDTYVVEVRGHNFGFWKAEFAADTITNLLKGNQPLQETVFTVNRAREGYTALSGWNFTIPEERKTVLYALQTLIDYFNESHD